MEIGTARDHTATYASSALRADSPYELTPCAPTSGAVLWAGSERPATWLGVGERAGWLRMRRGEAPPAGVSVRLGLRAAPFAEGFAWTAATVREVRAAEPSAAPTPTTTATTAPSQEGVAGADTVDILVERRVRQSLRPSIFERVARRLQRR